MIILILLVFLWTTYALTKLLSAQHARSPRADRSRGAHAGSPRTAPDLPGSDGPAWSALDDRQLTRLLTDSAPRSPTE